MGRNAHLSPVGADHLEVEPRESPVGEVGRKYLTFRPALGLGKPEPHPQIT